MSDGKDTTDQSVFYNPGEPYGKRPTGEEVLLSDFFDQSVEAEPEEAAETPQEEPEPEPEEAPVAKKSRKATRSGSAKPSATPEAITEEPIDQSGDNLQE